MVRSIIDSTTGGEEEVRRWYEEGKTYAEMAREYAEKYNLAVSPTMFSNRRAARGWERRIARDDELIPWDVKKEHRWNRYLVMLRVEARRRQGLPLRERDQRELEHFLEDLKETGGVIHYDPETEQGFFVVPRSERDTDLIREPMRTGVRTRRRARN